MSSYEEAWEAINVLIRRGSSFAGRERHCAFQHERPGVFVDVSGASGLDFDADGRAVAVWDFDRDGDEDLLLKHRSGAQVRILRNDGRQGHRVAILLEGRGGNRHAIGAKVSVEIGGRKHVREVRAGSGYLSQNSRRLIVGLGELEPGDRIDRLTVRWPKGGIDSFENLDVDAEYVVRERGKIVRRLFRKSIRSAPGSLVEAKSPRTRSVAFLEPLAIPPLLARAIGSATEVDLAKGTGEWRVVNIWTPDCAVCVRELAEWGRGRSGGESLEVVSVVPQSSASERLPELRAIETRTGIPVGVLSDDSLTALGIALEATVGWRSDLAVPVSLLIRPDGMVASAHSGMVSWNQLLADKQRRASSSFELPFPGKYHAFRPVRDVLNLGTRYANAGFHTLARDLFRAALSGRPGDIDALYNCGISELKLGLTAEAERSFSRLVALTPESVDARTNFGLTLIARGEFQRARTQLERGYAIDPGHGENLAALGILAMETGDDARARQWLERAVSVGPRQARPRRLLGAVLRRLERLEEAEAQYRIIVDLQPADATAWSDRAVILAELGRLEDALASIERAVAESAGTVASVQNNHGLILHSIGRTDRAAEAFEKAITLDPRSAPAYLNLVRVRLSRNEIGQARKVIRALLRQHPDHPVGREIARQLNGS